MIGVGRFFTWCNKGGMYGSGPAPGDTYEIQISLSEHGQDADGDGVADAEDCNPYSDLSDTVFVGSCDTGVRNTLFPDGCTVTDRLMNCAEGAQGHDDFVGCVAGASNALKKERHISGRDKGMIQSCAARSKVGK